MSYNFEEIRSFNDDEYIATVKELLQVDSLQKALQYYLSEYTFEEIEKMLLSFLSIQDFQSNMACRIVQSIIDLSVTNFSYEGLSNLNKEKSYLYISNHRDIVLDSALTNYCLNDFNYNTCEIAIGSNLLKEEWVNKLVRLNKSFIVKRNIPKHEMLEASKTLSAYIKHVLHTKGQSVWIAQREGRAKDGNDKTNPGLLKMLGLISESSLLDYLISLNIIPLSISYQYDPCDYLKISELLAKSKGEEYVKLEGEDNKHMLTGMNGEKGNVHFQFGEPINTKIEEFKTIKNRNELLKKVAEIIDISIYKNYKLWDTNYIAYDLLNKKNNYTTFYTEDSKTSFIAYMDRQLSNYKGNEKAIELFLRMYANPVINSLADK